MDKISYNKLAKITGVFIGLILVIGISYAVLRTTALGEKNNTIGAGKLDVRIANEQDEIVLENAIPMTEKQGKKQAPYLFDVVNDGTIDAMYDLYLEVDEDISTLPTNVVRYYLTVKEEGKEEKILTKNSKILSSLNTIEKDGKKLYKLDDKTILINKTNAYKMYLWVDRNATLEQANNKVFEAKIRVEASQVMEKEEPTIKRVDVSENEDGSVYAYFHEGGKIIISGEGNISADKAATLGVEISIELCKKALTFMGHDVSSIETLEDLATFINNLNDPDFDQHISDAFICLAAIDTLKELGQNTDSVTDMDSLMQYLMDLGYMDADGNPIEQGEAFFTRFEEISNENYDPNVSTNIKNIVLEEGITNIPQQLFTGNESIREVVIPSTVKNIEEKAFYNCRNLESIVINNGVISIGNSAFSGCYNLQSIELPNSITNIGDSAFQYCSSLTSVVLPKNISKIEGWTFYGCTHLASVSIPDGVKSIGVYAFADCGFLRQIQIPESVTVMDLGVFDNCYNLTTVNIPSQMTTLSGNLFNGCRSLSQITLPEQLTTIGPNAFSSTGFTSLILPNTVTTIGGYAFHDCTSLTSITWSTTEITIGEEAFSGCTGLTSLIVPKGTVGTNAFENCIGLTELTLQKGSADLYGAGFNSCNNLVKLIVDTEYYGSTNIFSIKELVITGKGNITQSHPWVSSKDYIEKVVIEEGITTIERSIFSDCKKLKTISLPNTLTSIGGKAFNGCTSLTSISLPDDLTTIGNEAFYDCSGLTTIKIPNKITTIDQYTFFRCTRLTSVTLPSSLKTIGYGAFANDSGLVEMIVPEGVTEIGRYAFSFCTGLKTLSIPASVETVWSDSFERCSNVENLTINGMLTASSNYDPYVEMTKIKSLTVVGEMTNYTFDSSFTRMTMPWYNSKDTIEKVVIGEGVTTIGDFAFYSLSHLKTVEMHTGITTIGRDAFSRCTNIDTITLPNTITTVGNNIFYGWTSSQIISIDNTEEFVTKNWNSGWKSGTSAKINYLRS